MLTKTSQGFIASITQHHIDVAAPSPDRNPYALALGESRLSAECDHNTRKIVLDNVQYEMRNSDWAALKTWMAGGSMLPRIIVLCEKEFGVTRELK